MKDLKTIELFSIEELLGINKGGDKDSSEYVKEWLSPQMVNDLIPYAQRWTQSHNNEYEGNNETEGLNVELDRSEAAENSMLLYDQEELDWDKANLVNTQEAFEKYIQKWSSTQNGKNARHFEEAKERLHSFGRQDLILRQKELLLQDMKENPWQYTMVIMEALFTGKLLESELEYLKYKYGDGPYLDFISNGGKLEINDLVTQGVIPQELTYNDIISSSDWIAANNIEDIVNSPLKETDVYFFGCGGSGKTSMIASILSQLHNQGLAYFVPQIFAGVDRNTTYCQALINSLHSKKTPGVRDQFTFSCATIKLLNGKRSSKNPIRLLDLKGEILNQSFRNVSPRDFWNRLQLTHLIKNHNRKVVFFLLDYSIISTKHLGNKPSAKDQIEELEYALNVLTHDGPYSMDPTVGCTLSKVDTVALIMTKCDLMDADSHEERLEIAQEYISKNCRYLIQNLTNYCRKFGINSNNNYQPYIQVFSVGDFYVGNTVIVDKDASTSLINFLSDVTNPWKLTTLREIFRLFLKNMKIPVFFPFI